MKKLVSIFLTLVMLLSLATTALAEGNTTLKVTPAGDNITRIYEGHQLLKLESMSIKTGTHHPADCSVDPTVAAGHKETCYHYAYSIVPAYDKILKNEVLGFAGPNFWGNTTKPATIAGVSDEQVVQYLSELTSDGDEGFGTLRKVADRLYRAIKEADITPEAEAFTTTAEVAKGYWLFADVTNLASGVYNANSLVVVDTLAKDDITIKPKTALPTLTKKVKDIEDSEHANIVNMEWYDSADHDIGDAVPFKLTATLPSNIQYFTSYVLTFHDKLSSGLTFASNSVKVFMYPDVGTANADIDLNAGTDVTALFAIAETNDHSDCTFELSGDIYKLVDADKLITPSTTFVVYYEAELNEDAEIGNPGNPNTAYLEFTNDAYSDSTGVTPENKVVVFTYQLVINKVDQHGHPLEGAGFTLVKKYYDGTEEIVGSEAKTAVIPANGELANQFVWKGLDDGDYILKETTVPAGFNGMADRSFTIIATHELNSTAPTLTALQIAGSPNSGDLGSGAMTETVENRSGTALPETGAEGTMFLIGGGAMLVLLAGVFMITRKKMSVYED